MNTGYCKFDSCKKKALFYVVYGCFEQHVADTESCQKHLTVLRALVAQRKFRCGQCKRPIIKGLCKRIDNTGYANIITRDLNGKVVKTIPNPDRKDPRATHSNPPEYTLHDLRFPQKPPEAQSLHIPYDKKYYKRYRNDRKPLT